MAVKKIEKIRKYCLCHFEKELDNNANFFGLISFEL